ncbi:MAG: TRAP transporter small permease [Alphaproteobacteria bacterium]|nr:TRAP transporter small permease [Alphaproteobacteria bacterium]
MDGFIRLVATLSRVAGVAAAGMIVVSVIVVCQMVFARYVLGQSTVWQTPLVTYMLVASTFLGSPYVLLLKGHVNVDLVPIYLGHRGRVMLALFASAVSFAFCAVVLWKGLGFWYEAWESKWTAGSAWRLPLWIPYLSLPLGMGLLCLQYLADVLSVLSGRDMPFGLKPEDRP